MITPFHAKYYAHELSRIGGAGFDRLGRALFDACVDLNPHQIESALFALRSPLSKGVLLADEVGLGKTIEAGLVLCQYWAERRRHLLVICPASLRKQWSLELSEKFNLPSMILDAKIYKEQQRNGTPNPFRDNRIIICSMHYAASRAEEIKEIPWNLVVIDEAHKLRNAYRQSNRIGQRIRWGTEDRKKLLLTATPLQNTLMELYGLSTLIDDRLFGEPASFRSQYLNQGGDLSGLRDRLKTFCWRTLRRQVVEYVKFTERRLITRPFKPTEQEHKLYEAVSAYLKRDETYALPSGQKHLLILLVRKVLASSPHAVAGTLEIMRNRLLKLRDEMKVNASPLEMIISGDDIDDDLLDEILEDEEDLLSDESETAQESILDTPIKIDLAKLESEINELDDYIRWARSIGIDTKTKALLKALEIGFEKMTEMGAAGMHNQVCQWAKQPYLNTLLGLLLDRCFRVYLTSDHGNLEAEGCGRPSEGAVADLRGERVRIYPDAALRGKVKERFPAALEWGTVGLPEDYLALLAPARQAFVQEKQRAVSHGGVSVEELIVPLIQIERRGE